jgi:hypothetical protein
MKNEKISKEIENEALSQTDDIRSVSNSMKEEQFMYLSIIVAILSYNAQIYWLTWIFGIKGGIEAITSIIMAISELLKLKKKH